MLINELSKDGFIFYDIKNQSFKVLNKLNNYLKYFTKQKDYDQIKFVSVVNNNNEIGTIKLNDLLFNIFKPLYIQISENKKVNIIPNDNLVYKKDGNFTTSGKLVVGPLNMYGKEYDFNYKKYMINLNVVDLLKIRIATGKYNKFGKPILKTITSDIENISGYVQIDIANNKSGMYNLKEYPIFTCVDYSYIYWDHPTIQKGKYLKNKFYYKLNPFVLDSLSIGRTKNIVFNGIFNSNIFQPFKQQISIQKDFSLGFNINRSDFVAYKKAKFYGNLFLNKNGLKGNGKLSYKNINVNSSDMLFLLDEFKCNVKKINIVESIKNNTPKFNMSNIKMNWKIKNDSMIFITKKDPMLIGKSPIISFNGELLYYKNNFFGAGSAKFKNISLKSKSINMLRETVKSKNSYFGVSDSILDTKIFEIDSVNYDIDLNNMIANFNFKEKEKEMFYPINKFKSISKSLKFDINNNKFTSGLKDAVMNFKLISTRNDMENLSFYASSIKYDNKIKTLNIEGVESIFVYTSLIKPISKNIIVNNGGSIKEIENAELFLDKNKVHRFINAKIDVNSSQSYRAKGEYIYTAVDNITDTVFFRFLARDKIGVTGYANVKKSNPFRISQNFNFYGKVNVNSTYEYLNLNGKVKITNINPDFKSNFFNIKTNFYNDSIYFKLNLIDKSVGIGLFFNYRLNKIYPTYMSNKISLTDKEIISTKEFVLHSKNNNEFELATLEKLRNKILLVQ